MNHSGESEATGNSSIDFLRERIGNKSTFGTESVYEDEDYIFDSPVVRFGLFSLYSVVFCVCFFGNLAVVLVVTLHWKMRSITKFCLGNLAFANLCVGIFCVYQNLSTFLMDRWIFGHFMCKMYHFINSLSHTASILILVVICVERYLAILHPFRSRQWITLTRLRVVIVTVWIVSALLCSPRLYYINTYYIPMSGLPGGVVRYDMICAPQQSLYTAHIVDMAYFVLLFLLPIIIISILYTLIGIHLWRGNGLIRRTTARSSVSESTSNSFRANINSETLSISSESDSTQGENGSFRMRRSSRRSGSTRSQPARYLSCPDERQPTSIINETSHVPVRKRVENSRSTSIENFPLENNSLSSCARSEEKSRLTTGLKLGEFRKGREKRHKTLCKKKSVTYSIENEIQSASEVPCTSSGVQVEEEEIEDNVFEEAGENETNCNDYSSGTSNNNVYNTRTDEALQSKRSRYALQRFLSRDDCNVSKKRRGVRKKRAKSRKPVIRMLMVIVVTFAICNLPFHIRKLCVNFLSNYDIGSDFNNLLTPLTFLLMYCNCAINPIIYAFMSRDFRSSLLDLLKCRLKRRGRRRNAKERLRGISN